MISTETEIRNELHIPPEAHHVVILSMDAHMDWDWKQTFQQNLESNAENAASAQQIMTSALQLVAEHHSDPVPYYYSICEMGFLQAVIGLDPSLTKDFAERIGDKLRIVGGGMTSPDSLLSHGETFIRTYLLGKVFLDGTIGLRFRQAYVPDDFGHDSQLPIVLQAMGFQGVSFSRIPGSWPSFQRPMNGDPSLADALCEGSADFVWQAADGSTGIAHFLQASYLQGNGIEQSDVLTNLQAYLYGPQGNNSTGGGNLPSSPTPYVYVPCGADFAMPLPGLINDAALWNTNNYHGRPDDVFAVVATLDHYLQLIATYTDSAVTHQYGPYRNLQTRSFFPTPYWTGFYASRPALKILHQEATRNLMAAETFAGIATICQTSDTVAWQPAHVARDMAIQQGWAALVPSTHHDYITGTSPDCVYTGEQLPLIRTATSMGAGARDSAMAEIAGMAGTAPDSGETAVLIFNQLGFPVTGLVELDPAAGVVLQSVRQGTVSSTVQQTSRGTVLFMAQAPSLGYDSVYLSPHPPSRHAPSGSLSYTAAGDGSRFTLENEYLAATITKDANWGLASLVDKHGGEMIAPGETGNDLAFYLDTGGLYCFGNETDGTALYQDPAGTLRAEDAVLEDVGPLQLTLRTTATFQSGAISALYIREYTLVAGEPFLRMSVTGASPGADADASYAVMVAFPLADPQNPHQAATVTTMTYGTPYHWVSQMPDPYWSPPIFQATHNFVLPRAASGYLGAIYHADIPAWAVTADNAVLGCILRNTPAAAGRGAFGTDVDTHTHHYALRVPSGLQDPSTCMPLRESLQFQTPLRATYAGPAPQNEAFPGTFSLAGVTPSEAIITAAKQGPGDPSSLVLRIYQPTNNARGAPLNVTVDLAGFAGTGDAGAGLRVRRVTALEAAIEEEQDLPVAGNSVSFEVERALTTLQINAPSPTTTT